MKIGILSDTHNNLENLQKALLLFQQEKITRLFHCGDLTSVETARQLVGFQVSCVLGNGDIASGEIREALRSLNPENEVGMVYRGQIEGVRIGATHGHLAGSFEELLHSGNFDYVFKGHSHVHQDERVGYTRLINPGALGGLHREPRMVCILDLGTGKAEFLPIPVE